jgi:hypothetical protein
MQPVQAELFAHRDELVDEPAEGPQRLVVRTFGPAGAQLVVEDHRPDAGEVGERLQVVMGHARAAVQAQQRRTRPVCPGDLVPDPAAGNLDVPLSG